MEEEKGFFEELDNLDELIEEGEAETKCTACPECGCIKSTSDGEFGDSHRVCFDCGQEWFTNVSYKEEKAIKYPAGFIVHWATGPVHKCDKHAQNWVAVGEHLGIHVPVTIGDVSQTCSDCENEGGEELEDESL